MSKPCAGHVITKMLDSSVLYLFHNEMEGTPLVKKLMIFLVYMGVFHGVIGSRAHCLSDFFYYGSHPI